MTIKSRQDWNVEEIWNSTLNPHVLMLPNANPYLFERWGKKFGIRKEDYLEMEEAKRAIFHNDWNHYDISTYANQLIDHLEDILKRPKIHPMQKKAAKVLIDKLKIKIIKKKYGSSGWMIITKAIEEGDIDPENYK
jgi:hypothetical protein